MSEYHGYRYRRPASTRQMVGRKRRRRWRLNLWHCRFSQQRAADRFRLGRPARVGKRRSEDGVRYHRERGGNYDVEEGSGVAGEKALLEAINKSGIRCDTGVKITATITGMAKVTGRGRNAAKLWTIKLDKAPAGIGEADLFD